jgi:predicted DNA-binding WGR domain protein
MTTANVETKTNGTEELKYFTIRFIPPELHRRWKMVCMIMEKTMEQFAVEAIQEKIDRYVEEQRKM